MAAPAEHLSGQSGRHETAFPAPCFPSGSPDAFFRDRCHRSVPAKSGFRSCHPPKTGGNDAEKIHPLPVHASGRKKTGSAFRRTPDRFFRLPRTSLPTRPDTGRFPPKSSRMPYGKPPYSRTVIRKPLLPYISPRFSAYSQNRNPAGPCRICRSEQHRPTYPRPIRSLPPRHFPGPRYHTSPKYRSRAAKTDSPVRLPEWRADRRYTCHWRNCCIREISLALSAILIASFCRKRYALFCRPKSPASSLAVFSWFASEAVFACR